MKDEILDESLSIIDKFHRAVDMARDVQKKHPQLGITTQFKLDAMTAADILKKYHDCPIKMTHRASGKILEWIEIRERRKVDILQWYIVHKQDVTKPTAGIYIKFK